MYTRTLPAGGQVGEALTKMSNLPYDIGWYPTSSSGYVTAPVSTSQPSMLGLAVVGYQLGGDNGNWNNSPFRYAWEWRRDGVAIPYENAPVYICKVADRGHVLTRAVIGTNIAGSTTVVSAASATVA